jgi:catechol 2,3-dioxygenase
VSEALYLWDPDGLGIEVYADRPRSAWRQRDRELVMTTDPLDISSVIDAGGSQPWEGMPSGTKIGHVHLRVGNLDEGERFYHAALGLDKTVWTYPGALFMAACGYHHHLGTNTWSSGPRAKDDEERRSCVRGREQYSKRRIRGRAHRRRFDGGRSLGHSGAHHPDR